MGGGGEDNVMSLDDWAGRVGIGRDISFLRVSFDFFVICSSYFKIVIDLNFVIYISLEDPSVKQLCDD